MIHCQHTSTATTLVAGWIILFCLSVATAQDKPFRIPDGQQLEAEVARDQQRNPFGEAGRPPNAQNRDVHLQNQLRSLVLQARMALARMEHEASRGEQLESILARLHFADARDDSLELLQKLIALNWDIAAEDSDEWSLLRQWVQQPSISGKKFLEAGRKYVALGKGDFPLNWRSRRDDWIRLATTIAASRTAVDLAAAWQRHIAELSRPEDAQLARLAYLAVVNLNPTEPLDLELVRPLYEAADDPIQAVHHLGQIYAAAASRGHESQDQLLKELRLRLAQLRKSDDHRRVVNAMRSLGTTVGRTLVPDALQVLSPAHFVAYAEGASFSSNEIASQFLAKNVVFECDGLSPQQAVFSLLDQVQLSVWVDEELPAAKQACQLRVAGAWKEVMQKLAARLDWFFLELSDGVFYLGPGDKLKHAAPLLVASRRTMPIPGDLAPPLGRTVRTLMFQQQLQFVDQGLSAVAQRLADMYDLSIQARGVEGKNVTLISRDLPIHLTLSLACYQADAKWSIARDGTVVIEPDAASPRADHLRERLEARQHREQREQRERRKAAGK